MSLRRHINQDMYTFIQSQSCSKGIKLDYESKVFELSKIKQAERQLIESNFFTHDVSQTGKISVRNQKSGLYLRRVFVEITSSCNLLCKHCYNGSAKVRHISLDGIKDIVAEALAMGSYRLDVTGGEPMLHPNFLEIMAILRDKLFLTSIFTNGTLITKPIVERIKKLGNVERVYVSLDDSEPHSHDCFRGVEGSFDKTMNGIKLLRQSRIPVVINTTLTPQNVEKIEDIYKIGKELDVGVRVAPVLNQGRAMKNVFHISDEKIAKIYKDNIIRYGLKPNNSKYPLCGVATSMIFIKSDGEICLCPTLSSAQSNLFSLGNICNESISDIWDSDELNDIRQNILCKEKSCKFIKICGGGCRSRAYLKTGAISEPDTLSCKILDVV
ncbi:radical SAM/SPASM domain-containing protein [Methanolacinia paynteri]|uniref:radical SAM/SPASM domain-containing protein n=1 Tax=Methanolacinia paynteri TaxID=230356 RepID=UPI001B8047C8|nr:radical SAM protein [Methanolacinia paynteri]